MTGSRRFFSFLPPAVNPVSSLLFHTIWHWLRFACFVTIAAPAYAAPPAKVVLLAGADPVQPAAYVQLSAIRDILDAGLPQGVELYLEAIDGYRFSSDKLTPEFLALMKKKYADQRIDVVIALGDFGAEVALKHDADLWPGTEVILSSVTVRWLKQHPLPKNFATVPYRVDVAQTLSLMEALQPDDHRLIVIGGAAETDLRFVATVVDEARRRRHWRTIERWEGLTVADLKERLATLGKGAAVIYTTAYRDRDGHRYFPYQLVAPMVQASHTPIYGWFSVYLDYGLTAGAVYDFEENGKSTGELALAFLRGERPSVSDLPAMPGRCAANVREFERLGLSVSRLPRDCRLINPPHSIFREYRGTVLTLLAVLIAQSLTIAALLTQRRRRRRAEAEASAHRAELTRAARFATVGELSASIAHEVGQPLGAILSNADAAELLLESANANPDDLQDILADVRRDALRANEVIVRLRALLEKQSLSFSAQNLDDILRQSVTLIAPEARRRGIVLDMQLAADQVLVSADHVQVQQVLLNLALNGMDAMQHTAPEQRVLSVATRLSADCVELTVADRGGGLSSDAAQRVFEPFYTTKPHGMGLGLSIVRTIVDAHRGHVSAVRREGGGTIFTVSLPTLDECAKKAPNVQPSRTAAPSASEST
ncbi:ATP-binding protein [Caballeronia sp. LP003]|uniref:sensor histidine kinase n=1 Tax=Caballeronia sp. LP003 TaxID=3038551 RepID=UPI002861A01F|nr:ATP-binding protein [Caballeronia sp. LP003]MDR5785213.1 ATP-binding protein [Caballeronia sp. LP003]